MRELSTDVVILGAGTAGLSAHRAVVDQGRSAILVDPGPLGTTGVRAGSIPSKLLIAAAEAAHAARNAGVFGVNAREVEVNGAAVFERVRAERARALGVMLEATDEYDRQGILVRGRGRFVEPERVQVDDHTSIRFRTAVIATGSHTWTPPHYRHLGSEALTNEEIFELPDLPESLLVSGTGEIGLELGQAFHRLGVRTTIVGCNGVVGPFHDPIVRDEADRIFSAELDIHPDYDLEAAESAPEGVHVRFSSRNEVREETYQHLLIAAGRRPNIEGLGLDVLGFDAKAELPFDPETAQLGQSPIFVAGDASRYRARVHEARDEGRIAGHNAAVYPEQMAVRRRVCLTIDYCSPQIAIVGRRFSRLDPHETAIGVVDFGQQRRVVLANGGEGMARVYAERGSGRILGAEMIGPRVEHLAHLLAWAIDSELTVEQALARPFYFPSFEEGLRTALRDLRAQLAG